MPPPQEIWPYWGVIDHHDPLIRGHFFCCTSAPTWQAARRPRGLRRRMAQNELWNQMPKTNSENKILAYQRPSADLCSKTQVAMCMPRRLAAMAYCVRVSRHGCAWKVIHPVFAVQRGCCDHHSGGIWNSCWSWNLKASNFGQSQKKWRALATGQGHQKQLVWVLGALGLQKRRVGVHTAPDLQLPKSRHRSNIGPQEGDPNLRAQTGQRARVIKTLVSHSGQRNTIEVQWSRDLQTGVTNQKGDMFGVKGTLFRTVRYAGPSRFQVGNGKVVV